MNQCNCLNDKALWRQHRNTEVELDFEAAVFEYDDGTQETDWECHVKRPCGLETDLSFSVMLGDDFATSPLSILDVLEVIDRKIGKHCASYYDATFVLFDERQT